MSVQELNPTETTPSDDLMLGEVLDEPVPPDAIERLPDGITLHLLNHEYWDRVVTLHGEKLTERQRYFRWFGPKDPSNSMSYAEQYAMCGESTTGIVAVNSENDPIGYASVLVGAPLSSGDRVGEFAAVVPDANAHKGICRALATCAGRRLKADGVLYMSAEVRMENVAMKNTLLHLSQEGRLPGATVDADSESGVISFAVDLHGMPDCELDEDGMPHMIPGLSYDI